MGDSTITILVIVLAGIVIFIFPLMSFAEGTDNVSQLLVTSTTDKFVNDIVTTGNFTLDNYEKFLQTITSTGHPFDVDTAVYQLDENPGVKLTQAEMTKIGENLFYIKYNSQVVDELNQNGKIKLKEGDMIKVTVKNADKTIAQLLRNFFYQVTGNNSSQIFSEKTAIVTANGSN